MAIHALGDQRCLTQFYSIGPLEATFLRPSLHGQESCPRHVGVSWWGVSHAKCRRESLAQGKEGLFSVLGWGARA